MRFGNPAMLWLLVLPPLLALFFAWAARQRHRLLTQFIQPRLLAALTVGFSPARKRIRFALWLTAFICLVLAIARPQWGFTWEESKQRGLDIVVAIDTSKSMLAEDIAPNRLARARLAALDLMRLAKADRLGLVAFAGTAFLQCPLTIDDAAFRQNVTSLDVNILPQGGTALAEAITTAFTAFKDEADNFKVLVLFTDGEDHDGQAAAAARSAAEQGMKLFTIGIGSPEGVLLQIRDQKGRIDYVRDPDGNVVKSRLNESLLQEVATAGDGFYLPLRGAKTMETLYEKGLAPLPKADLTSKLVKRYHERFRWPLGLGVLLLIAEMFFPERKRAPRPEPVEATVGKPAVAQAFTVLMLLIGWPFVATAGPSGALKKYEAGQYDAALQEYRRLLEAEKKEADGRLHFNAGAAAYQDGQFEEAAKQFQSALSAPDLELQQRAYYNLGNTLYRAGERAGDPQATMKAWEQSIKSYESALKLAPQDTDAQFNQQLVKARLEELKKQMPPQQSQSDQSQDQPKDQQEQSQSQSQSQQQQQQDQQQDQNNQQQQDQSQQQSQRNQQDHQQQQSQQDQAQSKDQSGQQDAQQQRQSQQQPGEQQEEPSSEEARRAEAEANAAGRMTPQQARQLLDAEKGDEQVLIFRPGTNTTQLKQTLKDW